MSKFKKYKIRLKEYWKQLNKFKKSLFISIIIFIIGNISVFMGLAKGNDIGSSLSKPYGTNIWTVSQELVNAWTYGPMVLGIGLIFMSIIFMSIILWKWLGKE